jgi:hypothetical protein
MLNAKYCRACGQPLGSVATAHDGGSVEAAPRPVAAALDRDKVLQMQNAVRRIISIDRMSGIRLVPVAGIIGLGAALYFLKGSSPHDRPLVYVMGVAFTAISWAVLFRVLRTIRNFARLGLKCPGCDTLLANQRATHCPGCGVLVPQFTETGELAE